MTPTTPAGDDGPERTRPSRRAHALLFGTVRIRAGKAHDARASSTVHLDRAMEMLGVATSAADGRVDQPEHIGVPRPSSSFHVARQIPPAVTVSSASTAG